MNAFDKCLDSIGEGREIRAWAMAKSLTRNLMLAIDLVEQFQSNGRLRRPADALIATDRFVICKAY